MKLEEAIDTVYETAKTHGEPLTRDVCAVIVAKLYDLPWITPPPGDIARYHRERYDGNPPSD